MRRKALVIGGLLLLLYVYFTYDPVIIPVGKDDGASFENLELKTYF